MEASDMIMTSRPTWSRVGVGSSGVAAADRDALGTTARLVVWPPANLSRLLAVVDAELDLLDQQASRFRPDSEISVLHGRGAGSYLISDGLAEAIGIALAAARWTGGRSDPTVGGALISLGYDRDFAAIESGGSVPPAPTPIPGWQAVRLSGNVLELPADVRLDLGATAKGLGADRAVRAAYAAAGGGGVLVSLGGDLAVAGEPPAGGWPLLIADEHRQTRAARNLAAQNRVARSRVAQAARRARLRVGQPAGSEQRATQPTGSAQRVNYSAGAAQQTEHAAGPVRPPAEADPVTAQQIRLASGGLATSSVTCRQWRRDGQLLHHIIDPSTGRPADGPWRTVSVVAASCAEANAASTAAIIAGYEAESWLTAQGLPARLVGHDGTIALTAGWPAADGGRVDPPTTSRLLADANPERR